MFQPISIPGQVVSVPTLLANRDHVPICPAADGSPIQGRPSKVVLVKTNEVEVVNLIVPEGIAIPTYEAPGEAILHCLEGQIQVRANGNQHLLRTGDLLYLLVDEPFSLQGIEDASLLVTIIASKTGPNVPLIGE